MKRCILAVVTLPLASTALGGTVETFTGWDGVEAIQPFGRLGTLTYGQTFTAPSDSILTSYETTFSYQTGDRFAFRFYLAQYDETNQAALGDPLFSTGDLLSPAAGDGFTNLKVTTNVAVTAGIQYVAIYSVADLDLTPAGSVFQGFRSNNVYGGGQFLYSNTETVAGLQSAGAFGTAFSDYDSVFRAEFQAVPEPAPMAVLGIGGLALLRRRKPVPA